MRATDRCIVLGSAQPESVVDFERLAAAGMTLARRKSGGAAVLVDPDQVLWVDVVVPRSDPAWIADVSRAAWWLGERWVEALQVAGGQQVEMWRGPMRRNSWSELVCFAGLGPGEVMASGRKVVGISQRRTRAASLFQCAISQEWRPGALLDVLRLPASARDEGVDALASVAGSLGADLAQAALAEFVRGTAAW